MLATLVVGLLCQTAASQSTTTSSKPLPPPPEPSWTFTVEPFLWIPSVQGEGGTEDTGKVDLDRSLPDAFGELDAGFLLALDAVAPESKFSLFGDGLYLRMKDENGSINSKTQVTMIEAGAGLPLGRSGVEAIAGLRYVDLSLDVDVGSALDSDASKSWVDPWVGARWRWRFAENWTLQLRGDVGGFGVGTDFTWQAVAALRFSFFDHWSISAGYRAISLDFSDDELKYDAIIHGPVIGLAFTW